MAPRLPGRHHRNHPPGGEWRDGWEWRPGCLAGTTATTRLAGSGVTAGSGAPVAWQAPPLPPARREWRHMRGWPTDLSPAGAAQAGVGSERAPTGRDGPDGTGREHSYKEKKLEAERGP
ncbi:hypothetical protein GCM10010112_25230 [Actinoplanes lobatus]|nr:hypothetical protein GCM10010112_25230 [Actinoplanes lobatus]